MFNFGSFLWVGRFVKVACSVLFSSCIFILRFRGKWGLGIFSVYLFQGPAMNLASGKACLLWSCNKGNEAELRGNGYVSGPFWC